MEDYIVKHATPDPKTYLSLRESTGLPAKTLQAATTGLANTLFAVQIIPSSSSELVIGMGRIVGDSGCFFLVTDIAVLPAYQGKGVGKLIMKELRAWMDENVPESASVHLLADGRANELYKQFGFVESASRPPYFSVGMELNF